MAVSSPLAAPASTGPRRVAGPRSWSTPTWLIALLVVIVIAAVVSGATTILGLSGQRRSLKTIGHNTAPSIIAAQNIAFSMADMDASLANYLLV